MLAETVDLPWGLQLDEPEIETVYRLHWSVREWHEHTETHPCKKVLGIRDPRDTVVSGYYMLCRESAQCSTDSLSLRDYIEQYFLRLREPEIELDLGLPACSWAEFYRQWLEEGVDCVVRHEDMMADPWIELHRVAQALDLHIAGDVNAIIKQYAHYRRSLYGPRYAGGRETERQIRRGQSRWHLHLSEEEDALIREHCGDLMREYEYIRKAER
jgi:hypothetical protein